jgi:hypothetical protein
MTPKRAMGLAGLDDRTLPKVAGLLRGIGSVTGAVVGPRGPLGRRVAPWIRREPVIVVAAVSVAFAAVLIAVTGGDNQGAVRPSTQSVGPVLPATQRLGPAPGASVSSYLSAATGRRDALRSLGASQQLEALVDLTGYISPLAVDTLLASTPEVSVVQGYARVPPPAQAKIHVLLTSAGTNLATELAAAQAAATQVAARYRSEVAQAQKDPSTQLQQAIDAGAAQAADARIDSLGLGSDCGCVFALVVSGPVSELQQLAGAAAVRVLDPAPVDASLQSLMVVPLEPQDTESVPPLAYAGD